MVSPPDRKFDGVIARIDRTARCVSIVERPVSRSRLISSELANSQVGFSTSEISTRKIDKRLCDPPVRNTLDGQTANLERAHAFSNGDASYL